MRWKISFQISEIFVSTAAFGVVVDFKCENASEAAAAAAYKVYGCMECTMYIRYTLDFLMRNNIELFQSNFDLVHGGRRNEHSRTFYPSPVDSLLQRIQFVFICNPISFVLLQRIHAFHG